MVWGVRRGFGFEINRQDRQDAMKATKRREFRLVIKLKHIFTYTGSPDDPLHINIHLLSHCTTVGFSAAQDDSSSKPGASWFEQLVVELSVCPSQWSRRGKECHDME